MRTVAPLTIAVPLVTAAVLAVLGSVLPRHAITALATAAAAATCAFEFVLLMGSWPSDLDYWFGNWSPQHHFAIGIVFTIDPIDASLACVVGVLMVAAMIFSWQGLKDVSHLYYVLMLVFLAGMSGFALSGDLFNLFVFFELMSVCGYSLCGFRNTGATVVQGALNFAIINSIGAFFILMGIALIYGRTGALNLAQIAAYLHGTRPDGLVIVSFVLVLVGFLTKAGAVPFHFWLSDAYAVASAPVGALYAGIMSDLGLHAIAKVYSDAYAGSLAASSTSVSRMLIAVGVITVIVGAVMCFLQADIKRQMAFLVVSHGGIFLCGIGLLTAEGIAGSTLYVAADGMLKGAIFLIIGYIVVVLGASDELMLRGRGRARAHVLAGVAFACAGLGLAALPGFGTWLSASLIEQAADANGFGWLPPILAFGTALTAAAILRAGARIFLGWGPSRDPLLTSRQPDEPEEGEPREEEREARGPFRRVLIPAGGLLVVGYGLSFAPHLSSYAVQAGHSFLDLPAYIGQVLHGHLPAVPLRLPAVETSSGAWIYGAATTTGALALALGGLYWQQVPERVRNVLRSAGGPVVHGIKALHSGRVTDMATWLVLGAVALCAAAAATFH